MAGQLPQWRGGIALSAIGGNCSTIIKVVTLLPRTVGHFTTYPRRLGKHCTNLLKTREILNHTNEKATVSATNQDFAKCVALSHQFVKSHTWIIGSSLNLRGILKYLN